MDLSALLESISSKNNFEENNASNQNVLGVLPMLLNGNLNEKVLLEQMAKNNPNIKQFLPLMQILSENQKIKNKSHKKTFNFTKIKEYYKK